MAGREAGAAGHDRRRVSRARASAQPPVKSPVVPVALVAFALAGWMFRHWMYRGERSLRRAADGVSFDLRSVPVKKP